jgi:chromosome segregation ATPase
MFIRIIALTAALPLICVQPLWARPQKEVSRIKDMVEYTLQQLTVSVQQIADRNEWLKTEINSLRQQVPQTKTFLLSLRRQTENASTRNSKMNEISHSENTEITVYESNTGRLNQLIQSLENEVTELDRRAQAKQENLNQMKRGIQANELEISRMQKELGILKELKTAPSQSSRQTDDLLEQYRLSQDRVRKAQVVLSEIMRKHDQPSGSVEALVSRQRLLKERVNIMNEEIVSTMNDKRKIERQVEQIRKASAEDLDPVNQEIAQLQKRQKELKIVLAEARKKLDGRNLDRTKDEAVQMTNNLRIIEKERQQLMQQLSLLETDKKIVR